LPRLAGLRGGPLHAEHDARRGQAQSDRQRPVQRLAFDQAHRSTLWPEALEIGMEFFTAAVEHLMLHHFHHDHAQFRPSAELWVQAVKASGYVQATLSGVAPDEA
jgi:DNA-binding helix-hairpin-helix protein with protein kinase domain